MVQDIEIIIDNFSDIIFAALQNVSEIKGSRLSSAVEAGTATIISSLYPEISAEQVIDYFLNGTPLTESTQEKGDKNKMRIFKENEETFNCYICEEEYPIEDLSDVEEMEKNGYETGDKKICKHCAKLFDEPLNEN